MINKNDNPIEWALLMYELSDAHEHLEKLIKQMSSKDFIDEIDYKINIAHIYSHINRAYKSRAHIGDINTEKHTEFSQFPIEIDPV